MRSRGRSMLHHERVTATARIVVVVAEFYGLDFEDVLGDTRTWRVSAARKASMWLCRAIYGWEFNSIGKLFQRDHSTVMTDIGSVTKEAEGDPAFQRRLVRLAQSVVALDPEVVA